MYFSVIFDTEIDMESDFLQLYKKSVAFNQWSM